MQKHKLELNLIINNPEAFLRGDYNYSLKITSSDYPWEEAFKVGPIMFEFEVDQAELIKVTVAAIDAKEAEVTAAYNEKMKVLDERRQQLMTLTHQPEEVVA